MGKFLLQNLAFQAILSIIFFGLHFFLGLGLALDLHCSLGELSEIPPTASDPPGPFHFGLGPGSKLLS